MSVDFPRAWQISKIFPAYLHESSCSYRKSRGSLLCDCDVLLKHREFCDDENFYGRDGKILEKGTFGDDSFRPESANITHWLELDIPEVES